MLNESLLHGEGPAVNGSTTRQISSSISSVDSLDEGSTGSAPRISKKEVKAKNMDTIYIKTEKNAASLDVAAPTSRMVEGGMEGRLFVTVIGLLLVFALPFIILLRNLARQLVYEPARPEKALVMITAFLFTLWPLYVSWRYSNSLPNKVFMFLRGTLTPYLFALSLNPKALDELLDLLYSNSEDAFNAEEILNQKPDLVWTLALATLFAFLLYAYRAAITPSKPPSKADKLRVLFIADAVPPKVDGVATFAEHSMQILLEKGHDVHLITSIAGPDAFFEKCKVTRFPGMTTPISPGHSITLPLPLVFWVLFKYKPHCVHLFEVSPLNLATFVFLQLADVPVSFSHHTRLDLYINIVTPQFPQALNALILYTLERIFYPLCDAHLCVSKVLFEKVRNRGTKNARFWSSGVNPRFDKSKFDAETRLEFSQGHVELPLVAHVGRLGPEKNSDEIPEIFFETYKIFKGQVRFVIVGGGILKEEIEEKLEKRGIRKYVHFAGFLRGEALERAYASCDLFFSPSTTEGFPLVFLEAMASGLAVVGPIAGGIPDAFTEGKEGCLYEPHSAKGCAKAIKRAVDAGAEMRLHAYTRGKEFSWNRSVTELEDLLWFIARAKYGQPQDGKKTN